VLTPGCASIVQVVVTSAEADSPEMKCTVVAPVPNGEGMEETKMSNGSKKLAGLGMHLTTLLMENPTVPADAQVMTVLLELPPGDPGTPPHRHSGPVFGYVLEGELRFELEGEPERILHTGDAFWEPGGDVIHYQAANNLVEGQTQFVAVMMCAPGEPMLILVEADELRQRRDRRFPRPA